MSKTFSPSHPARLKTVEHWDLETDVAVIGFGISGACAAIEAKQAGARVTIFEVAAASGGTAALSGGDIYLGGDGGTPVQKANGFEDTNEDMFKYLMMAGGPAADEARVRLYVENAIAHYHWLTEQGIPFKGTYLPGKHLEPVTDDTLIWSGNEAAWPFSQHAKPVPRGHTPQFVGMGAGKILMEKLTARVEALGIEVHYSTRTLALVADEDNRVHGVVVRGDDRPRLVRAKKAVILCAGGFICNDSMVNLYAPEVRDFPWPVTGGNDDGSGIRMGMAVGAAAIHMDQFFATRPAYPPESLVKGIFVNLMGQRFINEDVYHGRSTQYMRRQPEGKVWLLADNAIFGRPFIFQDVVISSVGETWEELESGLPVPPGELVRTVEIYNRHAANGEDPYWHKDKDWLQPLVEPPFAALSFSTEYLGGASFTLGGLSTLPTGQVLTPDREVIPGLYAAGRTACGLPRWGDGYSSGMSLGDASFFGRQAGKHAATFAMTLTTTGDRK